MCIAEDHAHNRHRDKAALLQHLIAQPENRNHDHQQERDFHVFRDQRALERIGNALPAQNANHAGNDDTHNDVERHFSGTDILRADHRDLIGQHGKQRTDTVIDDGFPPKNGGGALSKLCLPEQGQHNGRACNDQNTANHHRNGPAQPRNVIRRERTKHPANWRAGQYNAFHGGRCLAQLRKVERQPAFKEDKGNGHRNQRAERITKIMYRVQNTQHWPGNQTRRQHQNNGRQSQPPGEPLRANAENPDQAKCEDERMHGLIQFSYTASRHASHAARLRQPPAARKTATSST